MTEKHGVMMISSPCCQLVTYFQKLVFAVFSGYPISRKSFLENQKKIEHKARTTFSYWTMQFNNNKNEIALKKVEIFQKTRHAKMYN
jgi:hypothetical protein